MKAAQRSMGLDFAAIVDVSYGACDDHRSYATKAGARRAGRTHARRWRQGLHWCGKCRRGLVPNVFRCVQHWHWGHKRPRRIEMADQQSEVAEQPPLPDEQYNGLIETTVTHIEVLIGVVGAFSQRLAISEAVNRQDARSLKRLSAAYRRLAKDAQAMVEQCGG